MRYLSLLLFLLAPTSLKAVSELYDLDPILEASSPGQLIKLNPGVYVTKGSWEGGPTNLYLKPGVEIDGYGEGKTVVLCTNQSRTLHVTALWGAGGNTVRDLSVGHSSLNFSTETHTGKRNGIYLMPSKKRNAVYNSGVVGAYGNYRVMKEGFGLIIHGNNTVLSYVTITAPVGDYVQAISIVGERGRVENCIVTFPPSPINGGLTCFGQGTGANTVWRGNFAKGGAAGFYFDTGNMSGITLEDNTFLDNAVGVYVKNQYQPGFFQVVSGLNIRTNHFIGSSTNASYVAISLNNSRLDNLPIPHNAGSIDNTIIAGNYFIGAYDIPILKAVSAASDCPTPRVGVAGINNVTLLGNKYPYGNWSHRNKLGNATNFNAVSEAILPLQSN